MSKFAQVKDDLPIEWSPSGPIDYENDDDGPSSKEEMTPEQRQREIKQREHASIIFSLDHIYRCLICGFPFKQKESLMSYGCSLHTGELRYNPEFRDILWTCCERRSNQRGCTPCLHAPVQRIYDEMFADKSGSTFEIASDIIDYDLVEYNPNMFTNFRRGGDYSRNNMYNIQIEQQLRPSVVGASGELIAQQVKKFYFIPRIK